jgi:hypothetical protein
MLHSNMNWTCPVCDLELPSILTYCLCGTRRITKKDCLLYYTPLIPNLTQIIFEYVLSLNRVCRVCQQKMSNDDIGFFLLGQPLICCYCLVDECHSVAASITSQRDLELRNALFSFTGYGFRMKSLFLDELQDSLIYCDCGGVHLPFPQYSCDISNHRLVWVRIQKLLPMLQRGSRVHSILLEYMGHHVACLDLQDSFVDLLSYLF